MKYAGYCIQAEKDKIHPAMYEGYNQQEITKKLMAFSLELYMLRSARKIDNETHVTLLSYINYVAQNLANADIAQSLKETAITAERNENLKKLLEDNNYPLSKEVDFSRETNEERERRNYDL